VADFFCPGHDVHGRHNLAVFYGACTLNCLFCQNWTFRHLRPEEDELVPARALADAANDQTFCICYFGGDPAAQMPHALVTSRILARRGVAVCFETNGTAHPRLMRSAARLARDTGGVVKFDLKASDPVLHEVLTSASNRRVLANFRAAAEILMGDPDRPQIAAATLLVPGYVDAGEIARIAGFLTEIHPRIPYSLLAFAPQFRMQDLPATSRAHADAAVRAARGAGLQRVNVGNLHLLSDTYTPGDFPS
jgi:pyruvate formate lyase activating enzyme